MGDKLTPVEEKQIIIAKQEFQKFYNNKDYVSWEDEIKFAKVMKLETETQHNMSMIFYAGFVAALKNIEEFKNR